MTTEAKWSDLASMDGARTFAAASRLLPAWISLLLVIVIAWQLARIFWLLVPAPASGDLVATPAHVANVLDTDDLATDVNAIANAHIFGVASVDEATPEPVVTVVEADRDTRLNLALKGTIASTAEASAIAIISDAGRDENVYSIGDPVTATAKLHAVYADRVVLNENGVLTNLKLPKDFPAGSASIRSAPALTDVQPMSDDSQSIQSVLAQNVASLSDVIRPTPYFVDGQQQGYRVYPGRNRAQFTALGLRPGDLIKEIDGQSLSDQSQAMQIFQSLGSADQVSVTVERDGQPEVIVLRTDQLAIADETSQ
ncbi:MAG: type II secretion system protein GspC [Gammaproteobacteria bacterium]|nr:type II secretion system protein GspC [Gammaproteobacteria bacterium]MDH5303948.1 type II secretion system protein GspC [Gammaproteobacteria bacterium]MDH5321105.1 type II secretion system protein GspC [Gammaproteobacteria bacterium]